MSVCRHWINRLGLVLLWAAVFTVATVAQSEAAFKMRLDDPSTGGIDVEVADNGPGDINPLVGVITFSGAVGTKWIVNVTTGLSKPILPARGSMDLNSVNTSQQAATLNIALTDTDFPGFGPPVLQGHVGGTTQGTATFAAYKNDSNAEFDTASAEAEIHLGPFATSPFSASARDHHRLFGPYSMTLVASITHGAGVRTTSFDFEVVNVAEPASLTLFGLGWAGVGLVIRRRRQRRSL